MRLSGLPYFTTEVDGETLRIGPRAAVTPELAAYARANKAAIIEALTFAPKVAQCATGACQTRAPENAHEIPRNYKVDQS